MKSNLSSSKIYFLLKTGSIIGLILSLVNVQSFNPTNLPNFLKEITITYSIPHIFKNIQNAVSKGANNYLVSSIPEKRIIVSPMMVGTNSVTATWDFEGETKVAAVSDACILAMDASIGSGLGSESFPAGNGSTDAYSVNNWSTTNLDVTDYFEFCIAGNTGFDITLTDIAFEERRSATGIRDYEIRASTDDFSTFTIVTTENLPDNTNWRTKNITGLNIMALSGTNLCLRIYGYNAETNAGAWRLDNVVLTVAATNGCTVTAEAGEDKTLDCTNTTVVLAGNTTSTQATFRWEGPGIISGGTTLTPTVNVAGVYTLSVTEGTNCEATDQVTVIDGTVNNRLFFQGFENTSNDNWSISTGDEHIAQELGTNDRPINQRIKTGVNAWQVSSIGTATVETLELEAVNISGFVDAKIQVAITGVWHDIYNQTANGMDDNDSIKVFVDVNGNGFSNKADINLTGAFNARWGYGATLKSSTTAGTPITVKAPQGGENTNNYALLEVTVPTGTNTVALKIEAIHDRAGETWNVDDITLLASQNCTCPAVAEAGENQALTCENTNVILDGTNSSTEIGTTYLWSGPSIVSGKNGLQPTVNEVGIYILTVTSNHGCKAIDQVSVTSNTTIPKADAGENQALTCENTTVILDGTNSSTEIGTTYLWSGPSIISGKNGLQPRVNQTGIYILTVTSSNACKAIDQVSVTSNITIPKAEAGENQALTCENTSVILDGTNSSTESGTTYLWSGPSIVSGENGLQPTVNQTGIYSLTVTANNGCKAIDQVNVTSNTTIPKAEAGENQALTCENSTVILDGTNSSTESGTTYLWSGPSILSGRNGLQPTVNQVGIYVLTVTSSNACKAIDQVSVTSNTTIPKADTGENQALTCENSTVILDGTNSSTESGTTYLWSGPSIVSGKNGLQPTVNQVGVYILTVTSNNACKSIDQVSVTSNTTIPKAEAGENRELTCENRTVILDGTNSSTESGTTYLWSGLSIVSGKNGLQPTVNQAGIYILTVTSNNGCKAVDEVSVTSNTTIPKAEAGENQALTCENPSVILDGTNSSTEMGTTYLWSGPSIVSGKNGLQPRVNQTGIYILTVTSSNACKAIDQVSVTSNTTIPKAEAGENQALTCENTSVILDGTNSSTESGTTYLWSGPSIVSGENGLQPRVNQVGIYVLTVTSSNGCKAVDQVSVTSNTTIPKVEAGENQALTCENTSVILEGTNSSTEMGTTYLWSGPSIVSGKNDLQPRVNQTGIYILTVTSNNGCKAVDQVSVTSNTTIPKADAGENQALTCENTTVILDGTNSSTESGTTYLWSGPSIVSGENDLQPTVNQVGIYSLTVTSSNACKAVDQVSVTSNTTIPKAEAGENQALTCENTSVILDGTNSSTEIGTTYLWSGPSIVSGKNGLQPTVNEVGIYILTVTSSNACKAVDQVTVTGNVNTTLFTQSFETGDTWPIITGVTNISTAIGSGDTPVNQRIKSGTSSWQVNNETTTLTLASVNIPTDKNNILTFYLSSTALTGNNGADASDKIEVFVATNEATFSDSPDITITGNTNAKWGYDATLKASTVAGQSINLTAPQGGNNTNNYATVEVILPAATNSVGLQIIATNNAENEVWNIDDISLVATNCPTCTIIAEAGFDAIIDCTNETITLDAVGSSVGNGITYQWSGPGIISGSTTLQPIVDQEGMYTLTVTNGIDCQVVDKVSVSSNKMVVPAFTQNFEAGDNWSMVGGVNNISGNNGTTDTPINQRIKSGSNAWQVNNETATLTLSPVNINTAKANKVIVNVTSTSLNGSNGADGGDKIEVFAATNGSVFNTVPDITLFGNTNARWGYDANLTATTTLGNSIIVTAPQGGTNINNYSTLAITLPQGTETIALQIKASNNSASEVWNVDAIVVGIEDCDACFLTANAGETQELNCNRPSLTLNGTSSSTGIGIAYLWDGPNIINGANTLSPTINEAGIYTLTVSTNNICKAISQVTVTSNVSVPTANAGEDKIIDCTNSSVTLSESSTNENVSFQWSGNGIVSGENTANPIVNQGGMYTLTVTTSNGCKAIDQVNVIENSNAPTANAGEDKTINCSNPSITLTGGSTSENVSFQWNGLGIISGGNTASPIVNQGGIYALTVTTPNGCQAIDQVLITADFAVPIGSAGLDKVLNCENAMVTLQGTSDNATHTYLWTGPNIVNGETTLEPVVSEEGTYTLLITGANGCTNSDEVLVTKTTNTPIAEAGEDKTIDCINPTVTLSGSSSEESTTYFWEGPGIISGATTATPMVNQSGVYTLNITTANNCTASDEVTVHADFDNPLLDIGEDKTLGCGQTTVVLEGSASASEATYLWSGPGLTTPNDGALVIVDKIGVYTLVVTSENGCTATDTIEVIEQEACCEANAGTLILTEGALCSGDIVTVATQNSHQTNSDFEQYFLLVDKATGTVLTATNRTGRFNNLPDNDYLIYGYNVSIANPPSNPPLTGGNIAEISIDGCYDLSPALAFSMPQTFQILAGEVNDSEGEDNETGAIGSFDQNEVIIDLQGSGTTYTFLWDTEGNVQYNIQGNQVLVSYSDNATWFLTIIGNNNCTTTTMTFGNELENDDRLDIVEEIITPDNCATRYTKEGEITITLEGGTPPYTYNWTNGRGAILQYEISNAKANKIDHLRKGWYYVTIEDAGEPKQKTTRSIWLPCTDRNSVLQKNNFAKTSNFTKYASATSLAIYPNPLTKQATIKVNLKETTTATIELFNSFGQRVRKVIQDKYLLGETNYQVPLEVTDLSSGIYLLRLTTALGEVKYTKILIER